MFNRVILTLVVEQLTDNITDQRFPEEHSLVLPDKSPGSAEHCCFSVGDDGKAVLYMGATIRADSYPPVNNSQCELVHAEEGSDCNAVTSSRSERFSSWRHTSYSKHVPGFTPPRRYRSCERGELDSG